jgi:hypothetical protein
LVTTVTEKMSPMEMANWKTTRTLRNAAPVLGPGGVGRDVNGRIEAGKEAGQEEASEKNEGVRGGEDPPQTQSVAREPAERGKGEGHEPEGEEEGDKRDEQGFPEELDGEGPAGRAHDLAEADLLGSLDGAGRGEVHEVDAGDDQDEGGDDREQDDRAEIARGLVFGPCVGGEVDVLDLLEVETLRIARLHEPSLFVRPGRKDPVEKRRDLGFHVRTVDTPGEADEDAGDVVGEVPGPVEIIVVPASEETLEGEVGGQEIEVDVGIQGRVLHDPRDLHGELG